MLDHKADLAWIKEADVSTILKGKDEDGQPHLHKVINLYRKIFGEACSSCPNKILGYIRTLKSLNPDKMETTYKLKGTVSILDKLTGQHISNHNINDDVAVRLLSQNKNRSRLFSKLPKDWEEQADKYTPPAKKDAVLGSDQEESGEKPLKEMTLTELRALYPDIKATSKKAFLAKIEG